MTLFRLVAAALALCAVCAPALAQEEFAGSYLCQSEHYSGGAFDGRVWKVNDFPSDEKFVFKLAFANDLIIIGARRAARSSLNDCVVQPPEAEASVFNFTNSQNVFTCTFETRTLTVNMNSLAFSVLDPGILGFAFGVEMGRCTKVD